MTEGLKYKWFRTYGDENLSKAIQERLFLHGFKWSDGTPATMDHDRIWSMERDKHPYMVVGRDLCDSPEKEMSIDELFAHPLPSEEPLETVTIGDVTYSKSDFEDAVKDLKPVEVEG